MTGRMCSSGDGQERSGTQLKKERGQKRSWRRRVVHDGKRKGNMLIDGVKRREIRSRLVDFLSRETRPQITTL